MVDTIQKYITGLKHIEEQNMYMFSRESYGYYFALKMNACAYEFDQKGNIKNSGVVKEIAKGWYMFDPMKDIPLLEDFAKQSGFRKFYKSNKPYYDSLVATYNQLNPIQKMQNWLDKKFGFGYGSYTVYFSPLVDGAHSTTKLNDNNFSQTLMFICKAEMDKRYSPVINELSESRIVFTEIDHNYVNPLSDQMLDKINNSFSNSEKWASSDITNSYDNQYKVFNELENQMQNKRGFIKFEAFNRSLLEKFKQDPNIKMTELYDYILDWASKINRE